jgi:hypothetical protein
MLTAKRLHELIEYQPNTGIFTWRVNRRGRGGRKGERAGTLRRDGRWQICIDGKLYMANALAVLWMTGRWPRRLVDHRNCIKGDDRWRNLREANYSQNGANSHARTNVGTKGVTWDRARGKYAARIKVNYRTINLGRFDRADHAHAAYVAAAEKHFGEFARRL